MYDFWLFLVCKTSETSSNQANKECIFPFNYVGQTYTECTTVDYHTRWCATKVDRSGTYVRKQWGECGSNCQKCDSKLTFK